MSFLEVNGVPVPVADGSLKVTRKGNGARTRCGNGELALDENARKENLAGVSVPLAFDESAALAALLEGLGEAWLFASDAYGSRGTPPTASDYSAVPRVAAVGNGVIGDDIGEPALKHGRATKIDPAGTCLLPVGQKTCESGVAADYWSTFGSVNFAFDTTQALEGAKSLEVETLAVSAGIRTSAPIAVTIGEAYTFSVWAYTADAPVTLHAQLNTTDAATVLPPFTWTRISVTHTMTVALTTAYLWAEESGVFFYVDNIQLEQSSVATGFMPTASRVAQAVVTPIAVRNRCTLLLHARSSVVYGGAGGSISLLQLRTATDYVVWVQRRDTANDTRFFVKDSRGVLYTLALDLGWDAGDWLHIALAVESGADVCTFTLYVDGVSVGAHSLPADSVDLASLQELTIAHSATATQQWAGGAVAEVVLIPEALTAAQISSIAAASTGFGELPKLNVSGDAVEPATYYGKSGELMLSAGTTASDDFAENNCAVAFDLRPL